MVDQTCIQNNWCYATGHIHKQTASWLKVCTFFFFVLATSISVIHGTFWYITNIINLSDWSNRRVIQHIIQRDLTFAIPVSSGRRLTTALHLQMTPLATWLDECCPCCHSRTTRTLSNVKWHFGTSSCKNAHRHLQSLVRHACGQSNTERYAHWSMFCRTYSK